MPTALEAAGLALPTGTQGASQLPVVRGDRDSVRDWALVDNLATYNQRPDDRQRDMHQQTLVADGWKVVCYRHARLRRALPPRFRSGSAAQSSWDDPSAQRPAPCSLLLRLVQANMHAAGTMPERVAMA